MSEEIGLVLSGGGARGAYQVGVLSAMAEIFSQANIQNPIKIYSGVSAGAINAAFLAAGADDFHKAAKGLVDLWSQLGSEKVFLSSPASIGKIGFKWMEELSFGAFTGTTPGRSLLDTSPLNELVSSSIRFEKIKKQIESKALKALVISAMEYNRTTTVSFVQGEPGIKMWDKARRHSETAVIGPEHIMASSAIPLLFPPISVDNRYFGDGCIRNNSPCAPAIYLGAKKLFVIGVRKNSTTAYEMRGMQSNRAPSVARVLNVLLNAVMLDGIELDVERLLRVNEFLSQVPEEHTRSLIYKPVDICFISPSTDIGEIAISKSEHLPRLIRYLLRGLGNLDEASEIVSYLLFDPSFCSQLIEVGFEDGMKQRDEILALVQD
jgi:NTE family protein